MDDYRKVYGKRRTSWSSKGYRNGWKHGVRPPPRDHEDDCFHQQQDPQRKRSRYHGPHTTSQQYGDEEEEQNFPTSFAADDEDDSQENKTSKKTKEDTSETPDDEDDGNFPHLLHLWHPSGSRMASEKRDEMKNESGLKYRLGPWSQREMKQLTENMNEIVQDLLSQRCEVGNVEIEGEIRVALLGLYKRIDRGSNMITKRDLLGRPIKKSPIDCPYRQFLFRLGRGLPYRPLPDIFYRARDAECKLKGQKELDESEKREIIETKMEHKTIGDSAIAYEYNANPHSVQQIIEYNLTPTFEKPTKEFFTITEQRELLNIVMELMKVDDLTRLTIEAVRRQRSWTWSAVAKRMSTNRTISQVQLECYRLIGDIHDPQTTHIRHILTQSTKRLNRDYAKIIWFVSQEKKDLENSVDWIYLSELMPQHPFKVILQMWDDLKDEVPKSKREQGHRKTVKWLKKHKLPQLIKWNDKNIERLKNFYTNVLV